jgi:hypothetical protein
MELSSDLKTTEEIVTIPSDLLKDDTKENVSEENVSEEIVTIPSDLLKDDTKENVSGEIIYKMSVNDDNTCIVFYLVQIQTSHYQKVSKLLHKIAKHVGEFEKLNIYKNKLKSLLMNIFSNLEIDDSLDVFEILDLLSNNKTLEIVAITDAYSEIPSTFVPYEETTFYYLKEYSIGRMITSINCISNYKGFVKYAINFSNGNTQYFLFDKLLDSYYSGWVEIYGSKDLINEKLKIKKNQLILVGGLIASGKTEILKKIFGSLVPTKMKNFFDDVDLDTQNKNDITKLLNDGETVIVCNALFCDPRYLEYFLSCFGTIEPGLIKFVFVKPNAYQSSLNLKQRETDSDKLHSLLVSLKRLSLIYDHKTIVQIREKYSFGNCLLLETYTPEKEHLQIENQIRINYLKKLVDNEEHLIDKENLIENKSAIQCLKDKAHKIIWSFLSK